VFNQFGDLERCALRPGNVHSAEGWREVLEPVVACYRTTMKRRSFRADAGFAAPEVYAFLEAEDYGFVIRLPANPVLQRRIAHLLTRSVGRPPHEVWASPRGVEGSVKNPSTPGGRNGTQTTPETVYA
jgi:hypothetical protein